MPAFRLLRVDSPTGKPVWSVPRLDAAASAHLTCADRWAIYIVAKAFAPRDFTGIRHETLEVVLPPMSNMFLSRVRESVLKKLVEYGA